MDKMWLIQCRYDYYCQGWEETYDTFLVYAVDFPTACIMLRDELKNAHDFRDMTLIKGRKRHVE